MLELALGRVFYAKKHLVAWVARTSLVPVKWNEHQNFPTKWKKPKLATDRVPGTGTGPVVLRYCSRADTL